MRLEVVRGDGPSQEWCVTVDGTCVVGFAGPDARLRALQHREELHELLTAVADGQPDALPGADATVPLPPRRIV